MMTAVSGGISVVIPAYNAERTLREALESALAQTLRPVEILVIDDRSEDKTAAIVEEYRLRDSRVRLIANQENIGVSASRNRAVEEAVGEWIAFLDSDDRWREDKLERQLAAIANEPACAICFTATAYVGEEGQRADYVLHAPARVTYEELLKQNVISCSSVLVRREALRAYPMPDDRMIHEDYATWLCILRETPFAVGVDEPLLIYRVSASGKSGNKLRAAKMQWRTYRLCRVPFFKAAYCFCVYAWRNIRKYRSLQSDIAAGNGNAGAL